MPTSTYNIRQFWGQNFYRHSKRDTFCDFLRILERIFKKRKKSRFYEIWNKHKIRILEHCLITLQAHIWCDVRLYYSEVICKFVKVIIKVA